MSTLRNASTILLARDREGPGIEIFMVRRHGQSGFMAGAYVFPGGKLDEGDSDERLLSRVAPAVGEQAGRWLGEPDLDSRTAIGLMIAAVRETFEEAGVLLADLPAGADLAAGREALHQGVSFADVLEQLNATLRLDELAALSRWITPEVEPRRFDTRFFVAHAPTDQTATHDESETTEAAWLSPAEAIAKMQRGEIQLPPPTLKTLLTIADLPSSEALLDHARGRPAPRVAPIIREVDGLLTVILPGDPLHPEPRAALEGSTRIVLENGRFWAR